MTSHEPHPSPVRHTLHVPRAADPLRVDAFIASELPSLSRSRVSELIDMGNVLVNDHVCRRAKKLRGGETVVITVPPPPDRPLEPVPMNLSILYQDNHLAVISKPAGVVVHPGARTTEPTLVHGLLHTFPDIADLGEPERPGIVHRLDKDTSGCLIIARTEEARLKLIDMFAQRHIHKQYYALVKGAPREPQFGIERQIGRSARDRKKMSVNSPEGREAITYVTLAESLGGAASALAVRIVTGRTHQIRVHLAYIGLPVLGDKVYGKAARDLSHEVGAKRQMLHAHKLTFRHPLTGADLALVCPIPEDILEVRDTLRRKFADSMPDF